MHAEASPADAPRRHRVVRGLVAAGLSFVVPGTGQWYAGRRRSAAALLSVSLIIALGVGWLVTRNVAQLAGWLIRTDTFIAMFALNAGLLAFRAYATIDAYDAARHGKHDVADSAEASRFARAGTACLAVVAVGALLTPHVLASWYAAQTRGMLTTVFAGEQSLSNPAQRDAPAPDDRPAPEPLSDQGATADATPLPPSGDAPPGWPESLAVPERVAPDDETDEEPTPLAQPPANPWMEAGRFTVAVLGLDAGPGRASARTDALIVISTNTHTGETAVISIDRYLRDFPVPDAIADTYDAHCATGGAWNYINALHTCATDRVPERFAAHYPDARDPAAAAVADTLGLLLGTAIDHYAVVDMEGFVRLIDAFGGVTVDIAEPVVVRMSPAHDQTGWRTFDIPAGTQQLDGETALAYARMRDPGDAPRMRRQRCLLTSVIDHVSMGTVLRQLPAITAAIQDNMVTNVPLAELPDLLEVIARIDHHKTVGVGIGPPVYRGADHTPIIDRIHERIARVFDDPTAAIEAGRTTEAATTVCT